MLFKFLYRFWCNTIRKSTSVTLYLYLYCLASGRYLFVVVQFNVLRDPCHASAGGISPLFILNVSDPPPNMFCSCISEISVFVGRPSASCASLLSARVGVRLRLRLCVEFGGGLVNIYFGIVSSIYRVCGCVNYQHVALSYVVVPLL